MGIREDQRASYFPVSVVFVTCKIHISRVHHVRNPYQSC